MPYRSPGPKPYRYKRNSQALYPLVSFSAMFRGGRSNELGRKYRASATDFPCLCHTSPRSTSHVHVSLSSGRVQSIVPRHKLIIKSERLSAPKCIMSDPADLGSPSVNRESRPENIDGFDIPVSSVTDLTSMTYIFFFSHHCHVHACQLSQSC